MSSPSYEHDHFFEIAFKTSSRMSCTITLQGGRKISDLSPDEFQSAIAQPLWDHGVICVKGQQHLTAKDLVKATAMLGRPVVLPTQLAFNNRDVEHPEITRVGNIDSWGKKIEHYFDAKYWHTDGAYWPKEKTFITNWLQTIVRPSQGGNTAFIDMQQVYNDLTEEEREMYKQTKFLVKHRNLFGAAEKHYTASQTGKVPPVQSSTSHALRGAGDTADQYGIPPFVIHDTVYYHPITGKPSIYVGTSNSFMLRPSSPASLPVADAGSEQISLVRSSDHPPNVSVDDKADKIIAHFVEKTPVYEHVWEDGDVLLWDNTQTMHRGVGGIAPSDKRLLFRTQSQVLPEHMGNYRK